MQSARVIVLAGPSGAGKSRLAERLGLPVLRLDDFYKDGGDPTLPRITEGANAGHRRLGRPRLLAARGRAGARSRSCAARAGPRCRSTTSPRTAAAARRSSTSAGTPLFVAEGIFAQEIVAALRGARPARGGVLRAPAPAGDVLAPADPRPARAPQAAAGAGAPRLALMRDQRRVVADAVAQGCAPVTPDEAFAEVTDLVDASTDGRPRLRRRHGSASPTRRTCGAAALVVARIILDPAYAELAPAAPVGTVCRTIQSASPRRRWRCTAGPRSSVDVPAPRSCRGRRALGTPPWAVARQLSGSTGTPWPATAIGPWARAGALERACRAAARGPAGAAVRRQPLAPAPRRAGRAVDDGPAGLRARVGARRDGHRATTSSDALRSALAGWSMPVVHRDRSPARRTRA